MIKSLVVVDDFFPNGSSIREFAIANGFDTEEFKGHKYHGVGTPNNEGIAKASETLVAKATGIERSKVECKMNFFRIGMKGVPVTTYIHMDRDCGDLAVVCHLSPKCYGGTAFWTHKASGAHCWPDDVPMTEEDAEILNQDGNNEGAWDMNGYIAMRFNRALIYPTNYFHSRYPNHIPAETPEEGRLVWVGFYNLL